jgi:hypothetical protein
VNEFVIKIKKIAPDLGNKIESQLWTEKNILDLPDQYLLNKINTYSFEVAVMIICAMENPTKDKVLNTMGLFEKRRYNKELLKISKINDPATINTLNVALKAFLRDIKNDHTSDNIPYLQKEQSNVAMAA